MKSFFTADAAFDAIAAKYRAKNNVPESTLIVSGSQWDELLNQEWEVVSVDHECRTDYGDGLLCHYYQMLKTVRLRVNDKHEIQIVFGGNTVMAEYLCREYLKNGSLSLWLNAGFDGSCDGGEYLDEWVKVDGVIVVDPEDGRAYRKPWVLTEEFLKMNGEGFYRCSDESYDDAYRLLKESLEGEGGYLEEYQKKEDEEAKRDEQDARAEMREIEEELQMYW